MIKLFRATSLRWRLTKHLAIWQGAAIILLLLGNAVSSYFFWYSENFASFQALRFTEALTTAVSRDPHGALIVRATEQLDALRRESRGVWYVVRDLEGREVSSGPIPSEIRSLSGVIHRFRGLVVRPNRHGEETVAMTSWNDSEAGRILIIVNATPLSALTTAFALVRAALASALYIVAFATLATLIVTPLVIRFALSPLRDKVAEAERIDIKHGGARLSTREVPDEIMPLVRAVNDGLERLDEGYERHKRFLADAAHELRTPIAIVATRAAALPVGSERIQLMADLSRLNNLAGQLLDVQRLDNFQPPDFAEVDLVSVAKVVLMDLAPSAIDAGYEVVFEPMVEKRLIWGDEGAIRRAMTNLVQNAIDHAGGAGEIIVTVLPDAVIEVRDQGPGISAAHHTEIFEPFRRLQRGGNGAGLGLNLVKQIMQMHGGMVEVAMLETRGAHLRLVFPQERIFKEAVSTRSDVRSARGAES